ncbi:SDR family NAD(P)-dependent oxidoreductase [Streptomyces murinus]|nr:SDR family NAD(P)-dependent oxidoreductase [Streptomyces murinus]
MSSSPLQHRTIVVTGAARGLGTALARELARRGARLALLGHDAAGLYAVAASLPTASLATKPTSPPTPPWPRRQPKYAVVSASRRWSWRTRTSLRAARSRRPTPSPGAVSSNQPDGRRPHGAALPA